MVQVFQPLKVRDGDTACVDVHVGDDEGAILLQYLVSSWGDWSVGRLADDPRLHLVCIALVDHFLHGSRQQDVRLVQHDILASIGLSTRESYNGAMLNFPVLQGLGVDAIGVPDGAIPLSNANAGGASPSEIPAGVKAHVAKALHNVGLAGPARSLPNHRHEMSLIDEVLKAMEDTTACGAGPAVDATLVDGLASDTCAGVHICVPNGVGVSVSNPGHLPLACSHVRGGHIDAGSQEALLGELNSKPPGDLLKFILAIQLGVNLDACLATTEGDINTGALVGHQSRQGLNLVSTHIHGVTDTTLAGTPVVRMLRPVGVDHLKGAVITLQGKVHLQDVRTRLNDLQDPVCLLHFLVPGGADILHVLINERVL